MCIIRRLNLGEGELYKKVRLASLMDSPEAFCSRYEEAIKRSEQSWQEQADGSATGNDRATFIALDKKPIALASLYRDESQIDTGELIQMWVSPEKRGSSIAHDLIEVIFNWAKVNNFDCIKAEVIANNVRALRFYEKCGFSHSTNDGACLSSTVVLTKTLE